MGLSIYVWFPAQILFQFVCLSCVIIAAHGIYILAQASTVFRAEKTHFLRLLQTLMRGILM